MSAPESVIRLVERFENNIEDYRSGKYNETQIRREFIDPLFKALGWDVDNEKDFAERYKDVVHEDSINVAGSTKAPDYSFRVWGTRKFFVEAKKPSVNLKDDTAPAFQVRRYAWSAKLPVSILTDFEEFAVYDCRNRPAKTDNAATSRIQYFTYQDYIEKWDELYSTFSKDAVLKGDFDKLVDDFKKARGTQEVDAAFLAEIERWRDELARNLAIRNEDLDQRQLNFSVQRIIDRIIFLRIAEDRGIEPYKQLGDIADGEEIYTNLNALFNRADDRYNSGLFHFKEEKGRGGYPDYLTPAIKLDDKVLKGILKNLYYPDSPYEFSVLPADILGQVYEQFLGKVIRLTAGHQAKVEEKPEVKKAGGVYYTPTYIVEYIVENTVGKLVEGKTPRQVSEVRVLDPACGSGSFLLGAFQYLLDWHLDYYLQSEVKADRKKLVQVGMEEYRLTTEERKRILLNNIYGVDIDTQAVEVTKLSLLLKVLEGENQEQLAMFQERVLPSLDANIKCGNSLIASDFYTSGQITMFELEEEERYRINVFDWEIEFKEILDAGGFDAVIGNPPYGAWFNKDEDKYFKSSYLTFKGVKDVYSLFIEKGTQLLNIKGIISYIVPSAWLGGPRYRGLRSLMLSKHIESIIMLPFDVFKDAYIDTAIFILKSESPSMKHAVNTYVYEKKEKLKNITLDKNLFKQVYQSQWNFPENNKFILDPNAIKILEKMREKSLKTFKDLVLMKRGVLFDKTLLSSSKGNSNHFRYFEGDIYRYKVNKKLDNWVEFGDKMKEKPKDTFWFMGSRILLRRLVNRRQRLMAMYVNEDFITNKNLYTIISNDIEIDNLIILAIINSKLFSYAYLKQVSQATKDDFPQVTIKDILALPFPEKEKVLRNSKVLLSLVRSVIDMNKNLSLAKTDHESTALERQIAATDRRIDELVYQLYGLTEEEIKIVEESVG
ncbi:MAG: N-6 DNA methylase [Chloroflexi bacterium]|jgi:type I restriction-modification system DNA methylase subunit|nr:N-6 DNA methylase [Chloroflexota bacterium]MBT3668742.1 N-6 DNA methylase [Chloroflexota bacterium]MBT4001912.1 N-6 DNA methylase [Chloroflexota bacterium]MBT4305443.1 N-6 DNA methylase [Chloroflexota bacterium]MBT4533054.1 N-6 DNA methylase [Chloroflexota bacterium]